MSFDSILSSRNIWAGLIASVSPFTNFQNKGSDFKGNFSCNILFYICIHLAPTSNMILRFISQLTWHTHFDPLPKKETFSQNISYTYAQFPKWEKKFRTRLKEPII